MEIALTLVLLAITVLILFSVRRSAGLWSWTLTGIVVAGGILVLNTRPGSGDDLAQVLPPAPVHSEFESSGTCQKCHPEQYATWHASFHRTMTQMATPATVRGDFDDVSLEMRGRTYHLSRQDGEFWVEMNDPAWEMRFPGGPLPAGIPRVKERVLMTTGSHHLQVYWTHRPQSNGMLFQFPWVYSIDQQRWIPAEDSFLRPPSHGPIEIDVWNSTCIACHAVGGQPFNSITDRTMYSRVAEFGIACEACHGPGRRHLQNQAAPWNRYLLHWSEDTDHEVVNPERLVSRRSSEVCGSCHSASSELDSRVWAGTGRRYRAGQELEDTRYILRYAENPSDPRMVAWLKQDPSGLRDRFWSDGTMRVAGREFNAMIESACYREGDLSCLSCHTMHEGTPSDQLHPDLQGNASCTQCHSQFQGTALQAHTHHASDSPGSECLNCHMPYTTYGLYTGMRSHRIDNPTVEQSTLHGRPNACNLCHLDQTFEWTGRYLTEWYGQAEPQLSEQQEEVAASLLWLLEGDAVQRALAAWHLGWKPAQQASGSYWQAPFLAQLLDDPYSVVRFLSGQSIRRQAGFAAFDFDFLAAPEERRSKQQEVLEQWRALDWPAGIAAPSRLLLEAPGRRNMPLLERLIRERDRRPIRIVE